MIRVFKSPIGKRELRDLQTRITSNGWMILSIRRHEVDDFWLLKCANKDWFLSLPYEAQARVVLGRPAHD